MIEQQEFVIRAHLQTETLDAWIQEEWLIPYRDTTGLKFSDADIARARLIRDLKDDLGVNDEGIAIILSLVDQVHGLRGTLRELLETTAIQTDLVHSQPTQPVEINLPSDDRFPGK